MTDVKVTTRVDDGKMRTDDDMARSYLIRFDQEAKYLEDSLFNGFRFFPHKVNYSPSTFEIMKVLIPFWKDANRSSNGITWILTEWNRYGDCTEFWKQFADRMNTDINFKNEFSGLINMAGNADVVMKCFTELRDNQKIDTDHTGYFGQYGIAMRKNWAIKHGASQVIYVDKDSFLTNALGRLFAIYNCSAHFGKNNGTYSFHALRAFFDVWSFFEIENHSYEYEWRILGESGFVGNPEGFEIRRSILPFLLSDIHGLFVPAPEIAYFVEVLKKKAVSEGLSDPTIPPVVEIDAILLTDIEKAEVRKIFHRTK